VCSGSATERVTALERLLYDSALRRCGCRGFHGGWRDRKRKEGQRRALARRGGGMSGCTLLVLTVSRLKRAVTGIDGTDSIGTGVGTRRVPVVGSDEKQTYRSDPRCGCVWGPLGALARARDARGGHAHRLAMRQHDAILCKSGFDTNASLAWDRPPMWVLGEKGRDPRTGRCGRYASVRATKVVEGRASTGGARVLLVHLQCANSLGHPQKREKVPRLRVDKFVFSQRARES
jgi:hypothetical protein